MTKKDNAFSRKAIAFATSFAFIAGAVGVSAALAAITFSGTSITGDSSFNSIVGAASTTWDLAGNTLSLQTASSGPITAGSGLFTVGGILNVVNVDRSGTIAIGTSSATSVTIGRSGTTLTVPGSLSVGTTSTFTGILGVTNIDQAGTIAIGTSSATSITIGRSGQTVFLPGNASSTGTLTITSTSTGALVVTGGGTSALGPVIISGGALINKYLSATSSLNFGIIASTTCAVQTITVTNASSTTVDTVVATPYPVANGIDTASTTWSAWVSANNTVSVRACNPTFTSTVSIAAQTWRADVWQH